MFWPQFWGEVDIFGPALQNSAYFHSDHGAKFGGYLPTELGDLELTKKNICGKTKVRRRN